MRLYGLTPNLNERGTEDPGDALGQAGPGWARLGQWAERERVMMFSWGCGNTSLSCGVGDPRGWDASRLCSRCDEAVDVCGAGFGRKAPRRSSGIVKFSRSRASTGWAESALQYAGITDRGDLRMPAHADWKPTKKNSPGHPWGGLGLLMLSVASWHRPGRQAMASCAFIGESPCRRSR